MERVRISFGQPTRGWIGFFNSFGYDVDLEVRESVWRLSRIMWSDSKVSAIHIWAEISGQIRFNVTSQ